MNTQTLTPDTTTIAALAAAELAKPAPGQLRQVPGGSFTLRADDLFRLVLRPADCGCHWQILGDLRGWDGEWQRVSLRTDGAHLSSLDARAELLRFVRSMLGILTRL